MRIVGLVLLASLVFTVVADAQPGSFRDHLPADLPLDAQGIPTRPLDDAELHRLLLALSARNEAASLLLAACHAAGQGYGTPRWRACVDGGRR